MSNTFLISLIIPIKIILIYLIISYFRKKKIREKEKYLASTIEVLALYVDLNTRKVSEFEYEKLKIMDEFIQTNNSKFKIENLKFSSKLKK